MYRNPNLPKLEDMIHRRVYKIHCRNLAYGVWNEHAKGFIGIRTKFGDRFLFTEYHYDTGAPFGTVGMAEDIGIDVPEHIPMSETLKPSIDSETKRPVEWKETLGKGRGEWFFLDTGEFSKDIMPCAVRNKELFELLERVQNERRSSDVE